MKDNYLAIDLGTSAVKVLLVNKSGVLHRGKCAYNGTGTNAWLEALGKTLVEIPAEARCDIAGIGLSSQVGTYITDTGEVIPWDAPVGTEELRAIQAAVSDDEWVEKIAMVHPDLISYPLPRLMYIQKHDPSCKAVMMPKELLLQELTGEAVSDIFSWRGLCHPEKKAYAQDLLARFDIQLRLPRLVMPTDRAGCITRAAAEKYGLPQDIPVYAGCNDFYAGLLGMGVWDAGCVFALSGTSEHLGMVTRERLAGKAVSGPYFNCCATYGGTKASGVACNFAMDSFGIDDLSPQQAYEAPPIFLPYLKGERAPIYDENATGVFFGITHKTTQADMAYSVLEGVVFSLYHIGQALGIAPGSRLITGGGSAGNTLMAQLKAALFESTVLRVTENDSSALGAAMLAMVGSGVFATLQEAMGALVSYEKMADPDEKLKRILQERYAMYKELYPSLKATFAKFSRLEDKEQ